MCGVFGVFDHPEAANITYLGLHSLQHRGQESAGIVSADGQTLNASRHMGLVADVFSSRVLDGLTGNHAIGHVRYSTSGTSVLKNAQPFAVEYSRGSMAIAHNGNLVNAAALRRELEAEGSIFQSSMDTEVIVHLMARSRVADFPDQLAAALRRVEGAYSLLVLTPNQLIAARDPHGFRPLALGKLKGAYVVASESCAFELIGAEMIRDIEPGELIVIDESGLRSSHPFAPQPTHRCIFEYVYFARPDSHLDGTEVTAARERMGRELAQEHPVPADVVIAVPDSGVAAAIGYAVASQLPFQMGMIRSHYVGRTFIEPQQSIRHFGVKLKLSAVRSVISGRRVVVVDDSIVRGTTSRKIVGMLRGAGAKEVHMRISSPPTSFPCFYGIDTPTRKELIGSSHNVEEIRRYLTADSLGYLSETGLRRAVEDATLAAGVAPDPAERSGPRPPFCDACFTGDYAVAVPDAPPGARQMHLIGT